MKDGVPVAVPINVQVNFRLYDDPIPSNPKLKPAPTGIDDTTHFSPKQVAALNARWSNNTL